MIARISGKDRRMQCGKMKIWRAIRDPYVAILLYNCPAFLHTRFHRPDMTWPNFNSFIQAQRLIFCSMFSWSPSTTWSLWPWWDCQDPGLKKNHETSTNLSWNQTWQGKMPHWKISFLFRYQIIAIFHDFPDLLWQIGWTSQEKAGKSWYPLAVASRTSSILCPCNTKNDNQRIFIIIPLYGSVVFWP